MNTRVRPQSHAPTEGPSPPDVPSRIPGVYAAQEVQPSPASVLRSDVAGFAGRTRRGPVGVVTRVEGWAGFVSLYGGFGGFDPDGSLPYCVKGYFDNLGQVSHVYRTAGAAARTASKFWDVEKDGLSGLDFPGGFEARGYWIEATSPGAWGNTIRVQIDFRRRGANGLPSLDVLVRGRDESTEYFRGISPANLVDQIKNLSALIRFVPVQGTEPSGAHIPTAPVARGYAISLVGGADGKPDRNDYLDAVRALADVPEVALMALPDLAETLSASAVGDAGRDVLDVYAALVLEAEGTLDRLALIDVPPMPTPPGERTPKDVIDWLWSLALAVEWTARADGPGDPTRSLVFDGGGGVPRGVRGDVVRTLASDERRRLGGGDGPERQIGSDRLARAAVVYHPRVRVVDPAGTVADPLREVPASGHAAGVISRIDRERGAHFTPANTPVHEVYDVARVFRASEQAVLHGSGVNLIEPKPGRGILIWGGRTPSPSSRPVFVAHRRIIHRLVRALRGATEPLCFEPTFGLDLSVARIASTLLLAAFRAGVLKGTRPEEAFRVAARVDASGDGNMILCDVALAPAVPMEFIWIRLARTADDTLQLTEVPPP